MAPLKYRWRRLLKMTRIESSVTLFLLQRRRVWLTHTARVLCSHAANIEHKTLTQSEFCSWQNSVRRQEPPKRRRPTSCKVWLSDVGAVTKQRRETRSNMLGCPKLGNRSHQLVGQSSPYGEDLWRRYCCFTSFFPIVDTCLRCEDIARQFVRWYADGDCFRNFCFLYVQRAACSTFLNSR